jgi:hypothetical protein
MKNKTRILFDDEQEVDVEKREITKQEFCSTMNDKMIMLINKK